MTTILITGANGFIGKHLVPLLSDNNHALRLAVRTHTNSTDIEPSIKTILFDHEHTDTDYGRLLQHVDVVIHLAGIAHRKSVSRDEYKKTNIEGTARLATEAAARGVQRFIFLSTIKVHGDNNSVIDGNSQPITEASDTSPEDEYSQGKLQAENAVIHACSSGSMEYVILRPPLVYGPGVKANFLQLLGITSRGIPVPFADIQNKRSIIYVENLCDIIRVCIEHTSASNRIFVLKDHDVSITSLISDMSYAFGKKPRLFSLPLSLLTIAGKILGKDREINSMTGSLYVDDRLLRETLAWKAPVKHKSAMLKTVNWYTDTHSGP